MYRFSPTVIRLLITMCVEDSANAVIQEFRSVVQKLRKELDNAFKNAADLLENIGKPKLEDNGAYSGDLYSPLRSLSAYSLEMHLAETVKVEVTVECKPIEKETDSDDYEAEAKASSSEVEVKPTESTLPASDTSELEAVPVVHTGIKCKGCEVCTFLISNYFRSHVKHEFGPYRKCPSQAHVGCVSSVLSMIPMTSAASATRQLSTITACLR